MSARCVLALAALLACACTRAPDGSYQGYAEGEFLYLAAPVGGELVELAVARGQVVQTGAPLFRLDPNPQSLQLEEAAQRAEQARARLADLEKGVRPSELAALEARLTSARSGLERAERDYERRRTLRDEGPAEAVADEELDRFRAERDVRAAEVAAVEAELETARLGGRADAVVGARREVDALDAARRQLAWQIDEKAVAAPAAGLVQDTLFRPGEYVPAGQPVVVLLPPENLRVRFFVPQDGLSSIGFGDRVEVAVDGLDRDLEARVDFVSSEAEYTPPVIYSKESRGKLVFRVEARLDPASARRLRPGQPLEVRLP